MQGSKRTFGPTAREFFLEALACGEAVARAAKAVGVGSRTVYDHRERDPEFAEQWAEAYALGTGHLARVAWQRAVVGVAKPVFYKGRMVATVREPSDTLLQFLLRARAPKTFDDRARAIASLNDVLDNPANVSADHIRRIERVIIDTSPDDAV